MAEKESLSRFDELLQEIVEQRDRETSVCLCEMCCIRQAVMLSAMGVEE